MYLEIPRICVISYDQEIGFCERPIEFIYLLSQPIDDARLEHLDKVGICAYHHKLLLTMESI